MYIKTKISPVRGLTVDFWNVRRRSSTTPKLITKMYICACRHTWWLFSSQKAQLRRMFTYIQTWTVQMKRQFCLSY